MQSYFKTISKILLTILILLIAAAAQSGGQFAITQSVIANGGADSNGGNFSLVGTIAQANAGDNSTNGQFALRSGFWQAFFAPTAAQASVSGRVLAANGVGIRNARVTMFNQNGQAQSAVTSTFGYFRFEEVSDGETYVFTVHSKRFTFSNGSQILFITGEISDLVFVANGF